jgi:hypothetical protein
MLTYASEPADDWGPARKENQHGRYEIMNKKITESIEYKKKLNNKSFDFQENVNNAFDSQTEICSRL